MFMVQIANILNYITWDVSPFIYEGEHLAIEWYGTLWVLGLIGLLATLLLTFKHDHVPTQYAFITFIVALVLVLFFGHWFHGLFYEWYYTADYPIHFLGTDWHYRNTYIEHPLRFIDLRHGGFASHGTIVGAVLAGCVMEKSYNTNKWYFIDRILMGLFWIGITVRIGNLINTEICGYETTMPWGIKFSKYDAVLHPTQIYEIMSYLLVIAIGWCLFLSKKTHQYRGLISSVMISLVMLLRIAIECYKQPQMRIEADWVLNMGQLLSVPFAIWAIWFFFYSIEQGASERFTVPPVVRTAGKKNKLRNK